MRKIRIFLNVIADTVLYILVPWPWPWLFLPLLQVHDKGNSCGGLVGFLADWLLVGRAGCVPSTNCSWSYQSLICMILNIIHNFWVNIALFIYSYILMSFLLFYIHTFMHIKQTFTLDMIDYPIYHVVETDKLIHVEEDLAESRSQENRSKRSL